MKRLLSLVFILLGCTFSLFAASNPDTVDLKQALSTALSSGPDIKVAQLTLSGASSQLKSAAAKDGFSLGANTGYSHQDTIGTSSAPPSAVSTSAPGENVQGALALNGPSTTASLKGSYGIADTANTDGTHSQVAALSLSLSQTVFDGYPGGRAKAAYQQAEQSFKLAQVNFAGAKETVIYNVEQAYYTMLGAQHTVTLRKATLEQSKQDLARTNAFFKANQLTTLDVLTSQIAEQTAQADLNSAENALKQARSSLAVLLGWPIDKQFSVAEVADPNVPDISEQQAVQTALANRAELKKYQINRTETDISLKSAKSQRMPVVAVNGSASYNIYPGVTPSTNSGTWNAGVTVSVPLLDSGQVSAQVAQANDTLSQLGVQEAQAKQTITIDVRKSLFAVKDASVRLELAKESVKQAQGEYNLQKTKFTAGLSSNLDVIKASVTLANAQVSLETARTNLNLAILNLEQAMGTVGTSKTVS